MFNERQDHTKTFFNTKGRIFLNRKEGEALGKVRDKS